MPTSTSSEETDVPSTFSSAAKLVDVVGMVACEEMVGLEVDVFVPASALSEASDVPSTVNGSKSVTFSS